MDGQPPGVSCSPLVPNPSSTRPLLGTKAAAVELNVHAATLWRWHHDGVIPAAEQTEGGQMRGGHLRWDVERVRGIAQHLVEQGNAGPAIRRAAYSGKRAQRVG